MSDERALGGGSSRATLICPAGVTPEHLSAWRDGLQPPEQAQWLAAHTAGCPACQARLRDYDQIGAALREQMIPTSTADPWPAMRQRLSGERRGMRLPGPPTWGRLSAVVAAALIVALFAGLLARQASLRPTADVTPTVAATSTATAGPTATATPVPAGAWVNVSNYYGVMGLDVAPSDPRIAYQIFFQQQKGAPPILTLRRTDDQGASWRDLTPPSIPGVTYPNIEGPFFGFVSPIDPQVVYLIIGAQQTASGCGSNGIAAGHSCQLEYVSPDGGQTWRPLALPAPGLLTALNTTSNGQLAGEIQAQGKRLYGVITSQGLGTNAPPPPARLVASDDGGLTWGLIDGALQAAQQGVYDYAATPNGSTIFAATESLKLNYAVSPRQITLWRSEDGGVNWTAIGQPPNADLLDMRAAWEATTSTAILYLQTADSQNRVYIEGGRFDASGGHIGAPIIGANGSSLSGALLTTLSDGSVLIESNGSIAAFKQATNSSTSWRPVTQMDGLVNYSSVFTQTLAGGATRLWLVGMTEQTVVVEYATLKS